MRRFSGCTSTPLANAGVGLSYRNRDYRILKGPDGPRIWNTYFNVQNGTLRKHRLNAHQVVCFYRTVIENEVILATHWIWSMSLRITVRVHIVNTPNNSASWIRDVSKMCSLNMRLLSSNRASFTMHSMTMIRIERDSKTVPLKSKRTSREITQYGKSRSRAINFSHNVWQKMTPL